MTHEIFNLLTQCRENGWTDGLTYGRTDGQTDGDTDERAYGRRICDERATDEQLDGRTNVDKL